MAIGRGLSQGKFAAAVSGMASGAGILFHVAAASLGLTLLMQTSAVAFWVIKLIGAGYLLWLGIKVLRARSLISFQPASRQSLPSIFSNGYVLSVVRSTRNQACSCWHSFPNSSIQLADRSACR
ncbi:Lysine exporter protein LysE/YggA [Pseudomonas putida S11]|nr:Lysine exporter protein LysE/YggA [Pseudomonas putida S11]